MRGAATAAPAAVALTVRARLRAWAPSATLVVGGLVIVSTVARAWVGELGSTPWINADEIVYSELGRSLYATGHLEILGQPTAFYSLVYPALVGGPLSFDDLAFGYQLLKAVQALVMSLACVPVYLWSRSLMPRPWAYVAAVLTLALPGLAYSGLIMTEVAFYPVVVVAAWAAARALTKPTPVRQALAVGATALAAATRLQAVVLVPAFLTAAVLKVVLCRERVRTLLAYAPGAVGLAFVAGAWAVAQVAGGGPVTNVLGAYRAAGETSYDLNAIARFVVYHAGDAVLLSGILPAGATALLALHALRGRERSVHVNAYLAVTLSFACWLVLEVGTFASRHVGRLAERDLLTLAPLFFIGLALWLARGAPVSRREGLVVAAGTLALLVALPMKEMTTRSALPDAFTLAPLYQLSEHVRTTNLDLFLPNLAVPLLALLAFPPRRRLWTIPLCVLALLATTSVFASIAVTREARLLKPELLGPDPRWVDNSGRGDVAFFYGGESRWNAAYENIFWNRRIDRVYDLGSFLVPGPLPQTPAGPREDGLVVRKYGHLAPARAVVASTTISPFGTRVADAGSADLALWRVAQPFRLASWVTGIDVYASTLTPRGNLHIAGDAAAQIRLVVYACARGELRLTLVATGTSTIELRSDGRRWLRRRIPPWRERKFTVPDDWRTRGRKLRFARIGRVGGLAAGTVPMRQCTFDVTSTVSLRVDRLDFVRYG